MTTSPPSPFFAAQIERLRAAARLGPVADLACGHGRHALAAADAGARVIGFDRNENSLRELRTSATRRGLPVAAIRTDLESEASIPVRPESCGAILVFRFLYRPLAPAITAALRPGGLLLYETFTDAQPELGWGPRNPSFLLRQGELPTLFAELEILESWEGVTSGDRPEAVARLAARRR